MPSENVPMPQDEGLAAVTYLQAVWAGDDAAADVLARRDGLQMDTLALIMDLADRFRQILLDTRLGIHVGLIEEQLKAAKKRTDAHDVAQVTAVLIHTVRQ